MGGKQEDESSERSSEAEAIEELSMQQNEEVKSKDTKEQANKIVKDLHKTLQTPLTGWVPVVSALSVTAVDGGKEQEGLIDREKQRTEAERQKNVTLARKLESTQEDLMKTQIKYQKE